jgi:hypothetical protein
VLGGVIMLVILSIVHVMRVDIVIVKGSVSLRMGDDSDGSAMCENVRRQWQWGM